MINISDIVLDAGRDLGPQLKGSDQNIAFKIASRACIATLREASKILADKLESVPKPRSYEMAHYCMGIEAAKSAIDDALSAEKEGGG